MISSLCCWCCNKDPAFVKQRDPLLNVNEVQERTNEAAKASFPPSQEMQDTTIQENRRNSPGRRTPPNLPGTTFAEPGSPQSPSIHSEDGLKSDASEDAE